MPEDRRSIEPLWVLHEVDVYFTSADLHRSKSIGNPYPLSSTIIFGQPHIALDGILLLRGIIPAL
jgi:hypothetical protein